MARYPVDSINLASGYGMRISQGRARGHWGYDLAGSEGDSVRAPEPMVITRVWRGSGTSTRAAAPFDGYGPGGVEGYGDSGVYHLLAHMRADSVSAQVGDAVDEGDELGQMPAQVGASGPHVHWEVRKVEIDSPDTRQANTIEPKEWLYMSGPLTFIDDAFTKAVDAMKQAQQQLDAKKAAAKKPIPWWVWAGVIYFATKRR